jgi:hypothetical protein
MLDRLCLAYQEELVCEWDTDKASVKYGESDRMRAGYNPAGVGSNKIAPSVHSAMCGRVYEPAGVESNEILDHLILC